MGEEMRKTPRQEMASERDREENTEREKKSKRKIMQN
jgi:hypothetical protein